MRILIIEDDREAASFLTKALREAGHVADHAADGLDGYALAESGDYDVLVVDRMLPKLDGLSLIRSLREQNVETPVLILSALGQVDDRVKGLRAGGDDYLRNPTPSRNSSPAWRCSPPPCGSARRRGDGLPRRRPRARPPVPPGHPLRPGDPASAARVPAAGIPDAQRRPGRDPHHAAGARVGLSFRSSDERDRRARLAPARQGRQGLRAPADSYRPRGGLHGPREPGGGG